MSLENTHPFTRELWGRNWTYAHNGQLKGYRQRETGHFRPVGETDSEKAFCWILHKLATRYPHTPANDVVTVIAMQPLTGNETWHRIVPSEWVLFCLGERQE
nr:Phosphoheptose isomerase [Candidatus Pantoea persica]